MQKLLRKQNRLRLLKKKLNKLARLEKIQEKQSKKAKETFWKFIHWSFAITIFVAIVFSYGTFFPNPVSVSKIEHTQHHEYFDKLDSKLDKIALQNKKNLEEELLIELHQPEFVYNNLDTFIYAVRQCVDFINYTTEPGKRIPGSIIIAMAGIESGWGTSRFALEGNALFGVRTWDASVPQLKAKNMPDAEWGVKKYKTKCHSVRDMMAIINRHSAYKEFRAERNKQLLNDKWNYKKLLPLLESWSENTEYSEIIYQTIIDRNLP
jgi:hypothetical protein